LTQCPRCPEQASPGSSIRETLTCPLVTEAAAGEPAATPASTEPRVVFIHIPKTAGTTLHGIMRSNASQSARLGNVFKGGGGRVVEPDYERMVAKMRDVNADARFFWGHTPFAVASYIPAQWETHFITFLRDPVERAISQYYGIAARFEGRVPGVDDGDEEEDGHAARGSSQKQGVVRGPFGPDVPYGVALADAAYVSDNLQTRMLSGLPRPFGEVTDEMLERAIENLKRFRCVGITERFDESLVLLKRRIGYDKILFRPERVNSSRPRGDRVPEALRRAAEKANAFDRELYRHAVALFESAAELSDLDSRIDLAALRSAPTAGEAALPDAEVPSELTLDAAAWAALLAERRAALRVVTGRKTRPRAGAVGNADAAPKTKKRRRAVDDADAIRGPNRLAPGPKAARRAARIADGGDPAARTGKQKRPRDPNVGLASTALGANPARARRGGNAATDDTATAPRKQKKRNRPGDPAVAPTSDLPRAERPDTGTTIRRSES